MARVAHQLVLALFAMNHSYFVNDKTALAEIAYFACAPVEFGTRLQAALSHLGRSTPALSAAVGTLEELFAETVALAGGLYRPRFSLPH